MFKTDLIYGSATGLVCGLWIYLEYLFGFHKQRISLYGKVANLWIILFFVGIAITVWMKRKKDFGGILEFRKGLQTGIIVTIITAVMEILLEYLYMKNINPSWYSTMVDFARQRAVDKNLSASEIEFAVRHAEIYFRMDYYLLVSFLGTIFGGFCISLVVSSALERKTAPQPAAPKPAAAALPPKTDHKK